MPLLWASIKKNLKNCEKVPTDGGLEINKAERSFARVNLGPAAHP
jgi:hypothetical protein